MPRTPKASSRRSTRKSKAKSVFSSAPIQTTKSPTQSISASSSTLPITAETEDTGGVNATWKHPAELEYITPSFWNRHDIIQHLSKGAFTVPPRTPPSNPWTHITGVDGTVTTLPRGYRLPLMFLAKFQWDSLRLVLTSSNPTNEWLEYKFDLLHISRLCTKFLEEAREAKAANGDKGMERTWRSKMFDRALTRCYHRWMIHRKWYVKKFWEEFDEEEFDRDVLKHDWGRWVLKGHASFLLTKEEVQNGITAEQYQHGLTRTGNMTYSWDNEAYVRERSIALVANSVPEEVHTVYDEREAPNHEEILKNIKQEYFEQLHSHQSSPDSESSVSSALSDAPTTSIPPDPKSHGENGESPRVHSHPAQSSLTSTEHRNGSSLKRKREEYFHSAFEFLRAKNRFKPYPRRTLIRRNRPVFRVQSPSAPLHRMNSSSNASTSDDESTDENAHLTFKYLEPQSSLGDDPPPEGPKVSPGESMANSNPGVSDVSNTQSNLPSASATDKPSSEAQLCEGDTEKPSDSETGHDTCDPAPVNGTAGQSQEITTITHATTLTNSKENSAEVNSDPPVEGRSSLPSGHEMDLPNVSEEREDVEVDASKVSLKDDSDENDQVGKSDNEDINMEDVSRGADDQQTSLPSAATLIDIDMDRLHTNSTQSNGYLVNKVVSMVRHTLVGLNDILESSSETTVKSRTTSDVAVQADMKPAELPPASLVADVTILSTLVEEIKSLKAEIRELKDGGNFRDFPEVKILQSEVVNLRQRISSVEARSQLNLAFRDDGYSPSTQRSQTQIDADHMDIGTRSQKSPPDFSPAVHPLSHLFSVESNTSGSKSSGMSTPISEKSPFVTRREPSGDIIPLPVKTQRKFMSFSRVGME